MSAWILIVTTAWQFYSTGYHEAPVAVSMQEFSSQLACGRAADVVRAQVIAQTKDMMIGQSSTHAICVPKDAK
jgi:hypothetical protein